jgi:hypothetical protein
MQIGDDAVPMFVGKGAFVPLDGFITGDYPLDTSILIEGLVAARRKVLAAASQLSPVELEDTQFLVFFLQRTDQWYMMKRKMGGWIIIGGKERGCLNLPQRNLMGKVLRDMDSYASINEAVIGLACDPQCQKACGNRDGFAFEGERFRESVSKATRFLEERPDWTTGKEIWSSEARDRDVGLVIFEGLGPLEGEIIYFHDSFETGRGVCPEGEYQQQSHGKRA